MKRAYLLLSVAICSSAFAITAPAIGADAPAASTATQSTAKPSTAPANDNNNYDSDRLTWSVAIEGAASPGGPPVYCIPASTTLVGISSTLQGAQTSSTTTSTTPGTAGAAASTSSNTVQTQDQWLQVRLAQQNFPYVGHISSPPKTLRFDQAGQSYDKDNGYVGADQTGGAITDLGKQQCPGLKNADGSAAAPTYTGNVGEGVPFYVSDSDLQRGPQRVGWEYGALVVPFKWQLSASKEFTGSTAIGPYLGFRVPLFETGLVLSPVAFAGASPISVSTKSGTSTSSETLAAISYGGGFVCSIKDSFQAGVIVGWDHVSDSAGYQYNNKPWISFEIGYSFAQ